MKYATIIVFAICFLPVIFSKPLQFKGTCHNCHPTEEGKINVHVVPHSHDDVGWLKTVEQYYYGSEQNTKNHIRSTQSKDAGVQYIITTAVEALLVNPDRRYIQVETVFFWKWWKDQNDSVRNNVRDLIRNGRLEIINGGWTMNDEATVNYQSVIDQFTWGFRILNDTFGECARPKIGWQIDPFGHSREHASILSQMGFNGLVLGRIDNMDKKQRLTDKNLDFVWQSSDSLENSNIFTTIFPDFYTPMNGFCFDVTCYREDHVNKGNLKEKVEEFVKTMDKYVKSYKTNNILLPLGGDFHFQEAIKTFDTLDLLLSGLKGHPKYNVFYSTPSCYVNAVNEEINEKSILLQNKKLDFFPYGTDTSQWTGYFTSRPTSKRLERFGNNILQAAKQLAVISKIFGKDQDSSLTPLREAMGIMQHHDAITGTAKQAVAENYVKLITDGIKTAQATFGETIGKILQKSDKPVELKLSSCLLANVSICEISTEDRFLVAVYNPLSRHITHYVRLPVEQGAYIITGADGEEIYDVFDPISNFSYVKENSKPSSKELVFSSRKIPPLGVKLYYVEKINSSEEGEPYKNIRNGRHYFGTEANGFSIVDGKLKSITINEQRLEVSQAFLYYVSATSFRASGAFDFRPQDTDPKPISNTLDTKGKIGKLVDEVIQVYNKEVSQIIRVYKGFDDSYVEFDWLVGDLDFSQNAGKEVITRFSVKDFANNGKFYTDSNGRQFIRRLLNTREYFEYDNKSNVVSNNYYPITSEILIVDEGRDLQVAVLNDRAQGGTSLKNGVIEIMVNRRLTRDDGWGVDEALNEVEYSRGLYARGQHWFTFGPVTSTKEQKSTNALVKDLAQKKILQPVVLVGQANSNLAHFQDSLVFSFDGLQEALPENVKILTLEPWRDDFYLLRLEHVFEKHEDAYLSNPTTVHLNNIFTTFEITEIGEMTLGANEWWDDYVIEEKLTWFGYDDLSPLSQLNPADPLKISLKPMQIRTFMLKLNRK